MSSNDYNLHHTTKECDSVFKYNQVKIPHYGFLFRHSLCLIWKHWFHYKAREFLKLAQELENVFNYIVCLQRIFRNFPVAATAGEGRHHNNSIVTYKPAEHFLHITIQNNFLTAFLVVNDKQTYVEMVYAARLSGWHLFNARNHELHWTTVNRWFLFIYWKFVNQSTCNCYLITF